MTGKNGAIKVAWLCPYPIQRLPTFVGKGLEKLIHPATWLVTISQSIHAYDPSLDLHIVTESPYVEERIIVEHEGITFHVLPAPPVFTSKGHGPRIRITNMASLNLANRARLMRELRVISPSVVHAHGTERAYGMCAVSCGIPNLVSVQGVLNEILKDDHRMVAWARKRLEMWTIRKGSAFVVKSPFAESFVRSISPQCQTELIENPVHPDFFKVEESEQGGKEFLFVGTLVREKGIEELLRAVKTLPEVHLSMIGIGQESYRKYLVELCEELGINRQVTFLGPCSTSRVAEQMSLSSALVLPSYMETSPNVVMEAMCAGLPSIATNVGGIPFLLRDGITGLLVAPRDPLALAAAMSETMRSRALRRSMGNEARAEGRRRFDSRVAAARFVDLYRRLGG
jgi:glycosyltransferase involved in cell wall biosynthesis